MSACYFQPLSYLSLLWDKILPMWFHCLYFSSCQDFHCHNVSEVLLSSGAIWVNSLVALLLSLGFLFPPGTHLSTPNIFSRTASYSLWILMKPGGVRWDCFQVEWDFWACTILQGYCACSHPDTFYCEGLSSLLSLSYFSQHRPSKSLAKRHQLFSSRE